MSYPVAVAPEQEAERLAAFHVPGNHFADTRKPLRAHVFERERCAFVESPGTHTREIVLDDTAALGTKHPATTPTMLARYVVLAAGDPLRWRLDACTVVVHVIEGRGEVQGAFGIVNWEAGDVLVLPADDPLVVRCASTHARLFAVSDEPMWRWLGIGSLRRGESRPVRYAAATIAHEMEKLSAHSVADAVGRALIFTRTDEPRILTTPFFIANLNTLLPGADQRSHRHNGAALTLCLEGDACYSVVEGRALAWQQLGVMVTPAGQVHSHHNRGPRTMLSFVIQDSGWYEHARVPGFAFDAEADRHAAMLEPR